MNKVLPVLFAILLLVACANQAPTSSSKKSCFVDSDCVPAACCHASHAVNKEFAPKCAGMFCSQECAPGTIDCGQGQIKCVKNECEVVR